VDLVSLVCPDCGKPNSDFNLRCQGCGCSLPESQPETWSTAGTRPGGTSAAGSLHAVAPAPVPAATLANGQSFGPYVAIDRLGRGGMGVVYRARCSGTGQLVALKTLERMRATILPSLRREIHALSRLDHPGIVRILASGAREGLPWYAMELIAGPTLHQWAVQHRPLSEASLCAMLGVVRRLCAALAYLHGEGLVHRDLKPDNVLMRAAAEPVLADFGLSLRFGGAASREALEVEGSGAGTVAYMSPEQVAGELIDARADLYSLGCILYELLTGQLPFRGPNAVAVLGQHLYAEPVAPSRLVEGVPADLDALVLRLMAKQPRARLGHADDVAAALTEMLRGLGGGEDGAMAGSRPRAYLYRPGLVGREEPLTGLVNQIAALTEEVGGLVLVAGESGVGKTRLAVEAAREARLRHVLVVPGECLPPAAPRPGSEESDVASGGPLHPLRRLLQRVADRCHEAGKAETDRLLGMRGKLLAPYEPALAGLPGQEAWPEPIELPAEQARARMFAALAEILAALAAERALLLVLDDLQWADELTLGFLEFLVDTGWLGRRCVLVLGTYRTEEACAGTDQLSALQRLLDRPQVTHLRLGRLAEREVGALVGDMLALSEPPPDLVRSLARHSEGNPFFVAEYLRTAVAEGLLDRDGGAWRVAEAEVPGLMQARYETLPLPGSLRELVGRRLSGLSQEALRLLEGAAVLGRRSDEELLARVGRTSVAEAMEAIRELVARQVLEELESGRLQFVHDKIREVAYEQIPSERRPELHRLAAQAIEASPEEGPEEPSRLGYHWERAGEIDKAKSCYVAAAHLARERHALAEAEGLYYAYLRLAERPDAQVLQVRADLGEILLLQGRIPEAEAIHRKALEEARSLGERAVEGQMLWDLAAIRQRTGDMDAAQGLYEQALALAREIGDRRLEGRALGGMARLHLSQGRPDEAYPLYVQALEIRRQLGDRQAEGILLGNLANLRSDQGRADEARELYEQALAIHRQSGNRRYEGIAAGNLANLCSDQGRFEEARDLYERALAIHREIGDRTAEGISSGNLARLLHEQGNEDQAAELLQQALAIHRQVGNRQYEAIVLGDLGELEAGRGRVGQAQELLAHSLEAARQVRDRRTEGVALACLGVLARRTAELGTAGRRLEEAERLLRNSGALLPLASCLCERGHVALANHELDAARTLNEEARRLAAELRAEPRSHLGKRLSALRRAVEAFEAGRPLWRGECPECVPAPLRVRLEGPGALEKAAAPAADSGCGGA
jgi:predicted ATPase